MHYIIHYTLYSALYSNIAPQKHPWPQFIIGGVNTKHNSNTALLPASHKWQNALPTESDHKTAGILNTEKTN